MPMPDYDEYAKFAEENNILWSIPFETSRGCSWDQRIVCGDELDSCYFCGIRQPPVKRSIKPGVDVIGELDELSKKYKNTRILFCDCEIDNANGRKWIELLEDHKTDYLYKLDTRANVGEKFLMSARQSGCIGVQVGIEGLSGSYLKRLNKGTTTIQNLSVMRKLFELGIPSFSNLLLGFPGATIDEVRETADVIRRYAIVYEPLFLSLFELDAYSPVFQKPERFGVTNIRPAEPLQMVFETTIAKNIALPWLDFDQEEPIVDWSPVIEARREWLELHKKLREEVNFTERARPLYYLDGVDFLEIVDRRRGFQIFTLDKLDREVYLLCTNVISREKLFAYFRNSGDTSQRIEEIIEQFKCYDLLFEEGNEFLALAVNRRSIF